ncbi:transposase [Peptoniphilus indolicus ATCC 29427]|uniref:Transposase n=1 Tax=Peptoniphilus indolicus ATCC 29427 TaxID=997350 RepID=G4D300_9FIRM|nr:transposase [Peptoniphilus indolicus ATCC 29427]
MRGYSLSFILRIYKLSKSSLMRWNKNFDGTKESLKDEYRRHLEV